MRSIAEKLSQLRRSVSILNPLLFEDSRLIPEVKDKIMEIVDEFLDYTQIGDIKIMDIRLVGSNAAYNYTENSDLDIHIVIDLSKISEPETIARLYFDSLKHQFKESYDITIKGIDVEIYVEDINTTSVSNGIYSVVDDDWIKEPQELASEPTSKQISAAEALEDEILDRIHSVKTLSELQDVVDDIYLMRKNSLDQEGEVGAGNLAFKSLRNKGILDRVKKALKKYTEKKLSLEGKKI